VKEKFFLALDWKQISAMGLSTAAVITAYKISSGVEVGLTTVAKNDPGKFTELISDTAAPFKYLLFAILLLALWPLIRVLWKLNRVPFGRTKAAAPPKEEEKPSAPERSSPDDQQP
jgi:hypothetical protein